MEPKIWHTRIALENVEYVEPVKMLSRVDEGCGVPRANASSELGKCVVAYNTCEQTDQRADEKKNAVDTYIARVDQ